MSHQISIRENGFAEAAFAFEPAWHGLGQVVQHCPNSQEMARLAGLDDWTVEQMPLHVTFGDGTVQPVETHVANIRSDNRAMLGIVSRAEYRVVQNWEAFRFTDSLIESGQMQYESAGALQGGKKVWLLARMPNEFHLTDDDAYLRYLLFILPHTGLEAINVMPTSTRVVCANTLRMAMRTRDEARVLKIPHTGDMSDRLDQARAVLMGIGRIFDNHMELVRALVNVQITGGDLTEYVAKLYPDQEPREDGKARNNWARERARTDIIGRFESPANTLPGIRGTAWAAVNAATEYIDHGRIEARDDEDLTSTRERRFTFATMGEGDRKKQDALTVATRTWLQPAEVN